MRALFFFPLSASRWLLPVESSSLPKLAEDKDFAGAREASTQAVKCVAFNAEKAAHWHS